jgi:hypothetical protein
MDDVSDVIWYDYAMPVHAGRCKNDTYVRTEGTCDNLVAVGIVEGYRVHDVPVSLQRQQLVTSDGIPDLTCAVVTASDEFVSALVKSTVRQGQNVSTKNFK